MADVSGGQSNPTVVQEYTPGGPPVGTPIAGAQPSLGATGAPQLGNQPAPALADNGLFSNFKGWIDQQIGFYELGAATIDTPLGQAGATAAVGTTGAAVAGSVASLLDPNFWRASGVYVVGGLFALMLLWVGTQTLGGSLNVQQIISNQGLRA